MFLMPPIAMLIASALVQVQPFLFVLPVNLRSSMPLCAADNASSLMQGPLKEGHALMTHSEIVPTTRPFVKMVKFRQCRLHDVVGVVVVLNVHVIPHKLPYAPLRHLNVVPLRNLLSSQQLWEERIVVSVAILRLLPVRLSVQTVKFVSELVTPLLASPSLLAPSD